MSLLTTPPLSLYVHFPWCVSKCPYCDFNSYALNSTLQEDQYVAALEADLESQAADVSDRLVVSIFLGGGTPSLFSPRAIEKVLQAARSKLKVSPDAEVTMEANPGTVERGRFAEYRAAGVNRVSLGAQSFDARTLATLGRIHSPQETRLAAAELHAAGVGNFNLDLMYALPGQDVAGALQDLNAALELGPAHVSHYQLTLEAGTAFAASPPALPDDDVAAEMLSACSALLAQAGFQQYEVSGYAKEGRRCRHNLNYWMFGDYLGIGAGAHGKLSFAAASSIVRTTRPREPRRYLASINSGERPPHSPVSGTELPFEFMLNALRLVDGFERRLFEERTGLAWTVVAAEMERQARRGLVAMEGTLVLATQVGQRFLNDLLLNFLAERPATAARIALSTYT